MQRMNACKEFVGWEAMSKMAMHPQLPKPKYMVR
jgi:hypothetical protein